MEEIEQKKREEFQEQPQIKKIFFSTIGIAIIVLILTSLITSLVLLVTLKIPIAGFTTGNIIVISEVSILILFITSLYLFLGLSEKGRKRRHYTKLINKIQSDEEDLTELDEEILARVDTSGIQRPKVVIQEQKQETKYALDSIIYKKKVSKERCQICKLELSRKDVVVQCPICDTLFHKDHFIDWMASNKSCPVCGEKYTIETYRRKK